MTMVFTAPKSVGAAECLRGVVDYLLLGGQPRASEVTTATNHQRKRCPSCHVYPPYFFTGIVMGLSFGNTKLAMRSHWRGTLIHSFVDGTGLDAERLTNLYMSFGTLPSTSSVIVPSATIAINVPGCWCRPSRAPTGSSTRTSAEA